MSLAVLAHVRVHARAQRLCVRLRFVWQPRGVETLDVVLGQPLVPHRLDEVVGSVRLLLFLGLSFVLHPYFRTVGDGRGDLVLSSQSPCKLLLCAVVCTIRVTAF